MPENFLSKNQQYALKLETTPGTPVALTGGDVKIPPFFSNTGYVPDYRRFSNDQVSPDVGQAADYVGGKIGRIAFGFPFQTSGVLGTAPAIAAYLEACACKQQIVKAITISAPSGGDSAFKRGDSYSAASGTKTGIIEQDISSGGTLRYIPLTGGDLANTNVITSSGDTATASGASSIHSVKFTPTSDAQKAATAQRAVKNSAGTAGQDRITRIRGAMGTAVIEASALDAMRITGELSGPEDFQGAGSFLTGFTYESSLPPIFRNSNIQINGQLVSPSSAKLELGNTVSLDPDPSTDGGESGYVCSRVTSREPKFILDPRKLRPSLLDDLGLLGSGVTFPVTWTVGTSPNQIEITALKCQLRENTEGNREDLWTWNGTIYITRDSVLDEDFCIYFK